MSVLLSFSICATERALHRLFDGNFPGRQHLAVVLTCISNSMMTNDVEHLVTNSSLAIQLSSSKSIYSNHFLVLKFVFLLSCKNSLYILGTRSLTDAWLKILFLLHFHFLVVSGSIKVFSFNEIQFIFLLFLSCAFQARSKKLTPNPRSSGLTYFAYFFLKALQLNLLLLMFGSFQFPFASVG